MSEETKMFCRGCGEELHPVRSNPLCERCDLPWASSENKMTEQEKIAEMRKRFEAKYIKDNSGCWLWTAHRDRLGYGQFGLGGKLKFAHRVSYELYVGEIPEGKEIDHLCRNPACLNPRHLEAVTHAENMRRGNGGEYWALKTHCKRGHPYDEENTIRIKKGRDCKKCRVDRQRNYYLKRKLQKAYFPETEADEQRITKEGE